MQTCNAIHKKEKHFLYASDCWQGTRFRTNDRSVLNFPQAHSLRLSWKYFPSYHTHNWPMGVSLYLDIQRILCFDKITVKTQRWQQLERCCCTNRQQQQFPSLYQWSMKEKLVWMCFTDFTQWSTQNTILQFVVALFCFCCSLSHSSILQFLIFDTWSQSFLLYSSKRIKAAGTLPH